MCYSIFPFIKSFLPHHCLQILYHHFSQRRFLFTSFIADLFIKYMLSTDSNLVYKHQCKRTTCNYSTRCATCYKIYLRVPISRNKHVLDSSFSSPSILRLGLRSFRICIALLNSFSIERSTSFQPLHCSLIGLNLKCR